MTVTVVGTEARVRRLEEEERAEREKITRAARARAIIEDPLVVEVFERMVRTAFDAWHNSGPNDLATREFAYDELQAVKRFKTNFEAMLSTGRAAENHIRSVQYNREVLERRLRLAKG